MNEETKSSEKFTTNINISGVPITTKTAIDKRADKQGITTAGYIKNLINADLKADKIEKYNKAG